MTTLGAALFWLPLVIAVSVIRCLGLCQVSGDRGHASAQVAQQLLAGCWVVSIEPEVESRCGKQSATRIGDLGRAVNKLTQHLLSGLFKVVNPHPEAGRLFLYLSGNAGFDFRDLHSVSPLLNPRHDELASERQSCRE